MSLHWQTIILPCFLEFAEKEGTVPGDLHILLQQYYPVIFQFARDRLSNGESFGTGESIDQFVKARLAEIEEIVCRMGAIFLWHTLSDCSPNPSPTSDAGQHLCDSNTELDQGPYSAEESTHPISTKNEYLVQKMVDAMEDDSDTYDSESSAPYRKWRNMRGNYHDLAVRIKEKIDNLHNNEPEEDQGPNRQKRIESLLVLMKMCKGSVYKMAELPFYEKCVEDPGKMEKTFVENLKASKNRKRQPLEDGSENWISSGTTTPCRPEQNLLGPLRKKIFVEESSYSASYTARGPQGEMAAESQGHFQTESSSSGKSCPGTSCASGCPGLLDAASGSDFNTPPGTYGWGLFGHQSSTRQNQSFPPNPLRARTSCSNVSRGSGNFLSPDSINHYQEWTQKREINPLETLNINGNILLPLENRPETSKIHQQPLSANRPPEEPSDIDSWISN